MTARAQPEGCTMHLLRELARALDAPFHTARQSKSPAQTARPSAVCQSLESRQFFSLPPTSAAPLPRPDHVVIVVEENHSYQQILGPQPTQNYAGPRVLP